MKAKLRSAVLLSLFTFTASTAELARAEAETTSPANPNDYFFDMVREGHYEAVLTYCKRIAQSPKQLEQLLSSKDQAGKTALDIAVAGGHTAIAQLTVFLAGNPWHNTNVQYPPSLNMGPIPV